MKNVAEQERKLLKNSIRILFLAEWLIFLIVWLFSFNNLLRQSFKVSGNMLMALIYLFILLMPLYIAKVNKSDQFGTLIWFIIIIAAILLTNFIVFVQIVLMAGRITRIIKIFQLVLLLNVGQFLFAFCWWKIINRIQSHIVKTRQHEMPRVLIIGNQYKYLYTTRKELISELKERGYDVWVIFPSGNEVENMNELGCHVVNSTLDRHGTNLIEEYRLLMEYNGAVNRIKPDVILTFTIKPNLYGGIVAFFQKVPAISNITGLGRGFEKGKLVRSIFLSLYKIAFRGAACVFFQNEYSMNLMEDAVRNKSALLPGSGVNLETYTVMEYPPEEAAIRFIFIGRIEQDKGFLELIDSAKYLYKEHPEIIFDILGDAEADFEARLSGMDLPVNMHFWGWQENPQRFIRECHAMIMPSYHEGMSNVLLEAAAMGRPVIASRIPGCKEIFVEGITGLGVEARSTDSLIQALEHFIHLPYEKKREMGIEGRKNIEQRFDRKIVVDAYCSEIDRILEQRNG